VNTVVLIVDDSPLNIELARDVLEVQGYEVLTATNAEECFAVLTTCRPDLILMDIGLPGKDGLQITRDLRAAPATRDLCIVAMTAHAMADDEQRARAAGCNGYLTKPIQTRHLGQQVAEFLARARGRTAGSAGGEPLP